MTFSDREQLRNMDFEKMSLDELAREAAIARLRLPVQDVPTRRFAPTVVGSAPICARRCAPHCARAA